MAPLGRKGRILKWTGLVVCLMTVIVWAASMFWAVDCVTAGRVELASAIQGRTTCTLHSGTLWRFDYGKLDYFHTELCSSTGPPGWGAGRNHPFQWYLPGLPYVRTRSNGVREAMVPLWLLLVIVAPPTAYLWLRDRRGIPIGHCQKCGYNLTGNVSGVCSECGERI
ncbi:MAG: hypothetical protein QUS33_06815 [Dehalococcoidia bacterium]|nr:hypothetical protein [Dehalococcoidia bacterium]